MVADDQAPQLANEQDTNFGRFAQLPVWIPLQWKKQGKEAFALSEELGLPVILRPTTRICHACNGVEIEEPESQR